MEPTFTYDEVTPKDQPSDEDIAAAVAEFEDPTTTDEEA